MTIVIIHLMSMNSSGKFFNQMCVDWLKNF